ncbi:MAG TPA: hypothetical protein VEP49_07700 [Acidimicrobiia bacterium]|nr:hypothetical protein [Acidimicrobiia bacterium]
MSGASELPTPDEARDTVDEVPPMLPSRTAFLLAFFAVVIAGILGGIIGFGVADVGSDSDVARLVGTFLGALIGASGVGIVAVLVLRAMAEWNRQRR